MPIPFPSATLAEVCAPLPIVWRLLAENQAASSTASVSDYFRRALDGKWDQVRRPHPRAHVHTCTYMLHTYIHVYVCVYVCVYVRQS